MPDYRVIPSLEQLRQRPTTAALEQQHGHEATIRALRDAAESIRHAIAAGEVFSDSEVVARAIEAQATVLLSSAARGSLRPVINGTGVVIHTNLGRAPLADAAIQRIRDTCAGFCNLEYDLSGGGRGSRAVHAESALKALTGAEAAAVVNNNAAATMLILAALGAGREVVISRGELVEIGGGFRVPDVMVQSGAILREVGTTNRTRVADYRAAIGPRTAMLLRVHPSNFRIEGFTERPALAELVIAAREANVPLVEDLGSGCVLEEFAWEPTVQQSIAAGVDLVCFSGDKMLGGPQAGIIVGRRELVRQVQKHPLMRALRVDKLTLAALEGTLLEYQSGRAKATVPVARMLALTAEDIEARAQRLADRLRGAVLRVSLESGTSAVGGGSAPGVPLATVLLALHVEGWSAARLEQRLRALEVPVIARIEQDRVLIDLRTVPEDQDELLTRQLIDLGARLDE